VKWGAIVQEKANELARYLKNRTTPNFVDPAPVFQRTDDRVVRDAISHLTQNEANRRGIGKSTLHYLRKRAREPAEFRIYASVRNRVG
jgi:hypothetical protein